MTYASENTWRKALLPIHSTIKQAICNLDESKMQIGLVVTEECVLLGTITDGDIRRSLLRGLNLDSPIDSILHHDAFVVPPQMNREMVLHLMKVNKLRSIPVVDTDRRVVGLHLWDELDVPSVRPNLMIMMAGGFGTRLRPYTENCPKPMLPIAGKPMLEHIIERAKIDGFRNFVFAIHYIGHMIEEYFGDGSCWQVRIDYLREDSPLGTAGALSLLNPKPEIPVVVTNGDVLTDIRYSELLDFHYRHMAIATMAVRLHEWQHPFGVVHIKGMDIVGFEEKPIARSHVNAGIYVLDPAAFVSLNVDEHCDMPTLFGRLQERKLRTIVYPMHEPWLDVGCADDLKRVQTAFHE